MTTTWKIMQCDRLTANGFITTAFWEATTVDGDHTAHAHGACSWKIGTPAIEYASVTEQEVLDWCWASNLNKDEVEAALAAQIEAQKAPVTATGVPW